MKVTTAKPIAGHRELDVDRRHARSEKKKTSCRSTSWLMILVPNATSCGCWWIEGCRLTIVQAQTSCGRCAENESGGTSSSPTVCGDPARAITPLPPSIPPKPIFRYSASVSVISCWRWRAVRAVKMRIGHHGGNHPVRRCGESVVMITSRTTVLRWMRATLPANLRVTPNPVRRYVTGAFIAR